MDIAHENDKDLKEEEEEEDNDDDVSNADEDENAVEKQQKKILNEKKVKLFNEREEKKGIIYLSRIPPFMKPARIRHEMSQFGEVGRIYLAPESMENRAKRKRSGGNAKKNFTEGWVEFMDKRIAKLVALSLNNTPMGGKKNNYYRDDIWNIKYLKQFKWNHLTEKIAYEKANREKMLRTMISKDKRELEEYKKRVEKSKVQKIVEERKEKKKMKEEGLEVPPEEKKKRRRKKQKIIVADPD